MKKIVSILLAAIFVAVCAAGCSSTENSSSSSSKSSSSKPVSSSSQSSNGTLNLPGLFVEGEENARAVDFGNRNIAAFTFWKNGTKNSMNITCKFDGTDVRKEFCQFMAVLSVGEKLAEAADIDNYMVMIASGKNTGFIMYKNGEMDSSAIKLPAGYEAYADIVTNDEALKYVDVILAQFIAQND